MNHPKQPYVLATGDAGADRLRLLQRVMEPGTSRALHAAGLGPGMKAVDIGCGIGMVTRQIANIVGPKGRVTGIDASAEQIDVARRECRDFDRVGFMVASAYETTLPRETYDLAYCRFVLCHLERPLDALKEMLSLLRPGGVLLCEDQEASTLASVPPTLAYANAARKTVELALKRGVDMDLGVRLPGLLRALPLADVQVSIWQAAYFRGEEKRFYEHTLAEAAPLIVASGVTTQEEVEERIEGMRRVNDDEAVLVTMPRVWQVWGRKV
jgi:ubiquinone/menaquinone biosynthesis C-methylase UbiE